VLLLRESDCAVIHIDAGDRTFEVIEEIFYNVKFGNEVPSQPVTMSTARRGIDDLIRQLEDAGAAVRIEETA
jgi:hypothetical protein